MTSAALLDTSILIARESGSPIDEETLPERGYLSVITVAELHAGVLAATNTEVRARRLATLEAAAAVGALAVDAAAAGHWARLRVRLHEAGRRMNVNDLWIAAVAVAHDLPVMTQGGDFDVLAELGLVQVIRI